MKKLSILFTLLFSIISISILAQNVMPLPAHVSVYSGSARGFWFVAPVTFEITGLRVPYEAGTGDQAIQVVKINDPMPIAFTSQSTNFNTLFYTNTGTNGQVLPVSILINAGDTIGILGTAGTGNSYATGYYNSSIFSNTVPIQRFGYQGNINTGATTQIWGVDYQASGSISRVEVYYDLAVISNFPYCEGFEADDGSWGASGVLPSWEHGEPDNTIINSAYGGDNAWVTNLDGNYNNDELSYLSSPLFDFTNLVDPVIKFWQIRNLESGDDGVQVQVSSDSGATYSVLGSSSSTNWYNSGAVAALNSNGNGNGWTGTTSSWSSVQHSLLSYASDTTVFIRFVMAADGNTANEGFGIDNIIVGESNDVSLVSLIYPDSECGNSATVVSAVVCNISVVEKSGFNIDLDTNGTTINYTYTDTLPTCGCDTVDLVSLNTSAGGSWTLEAEIDNTGDVNAANDTLSGTMTMFSTPGVQLTGGGNHCQGSVDTLTFSFIGVSPWNLSYTNGTSPQNVSNIQTNPFQLIVTSSGVYEPVYVSDGSGCPADTSGITGVAVVNFFPAPVIDLGSDSSVCAGHTLDAGAGYSNYQWSSGQTSQSIVVNQTNVFSVTVTDSIGCIGTDVVDLEVFPNPVITIDDTVLCEGGTFLFNAGGGAASYLWHDGSTGQLFSMNTVGTVSVTVTSFFGCESSKSASITAIVPNPTPNITSTSSLAPVTLDAGAGYIDYVWNTNATTQTISVAVPGTYTCTVTDASGCKGEGSRKAKIWPTGVSDIADDSGFGLYPNPASEKLNIELSDKFHTGKVTIQLLNLEGRVVYKFEGIDQKHISISLTGIANGQYQIRLTNNQYTEEKPLVIIH